MNRLLREADWRGAILAGLPVLAAIAYLAAGHWRPQYTPDSPGYMYFDPTRPVGYPAFLALIGVFGPRYSLLASVQALLMAGSVGVLATATRRLTRSFGFSLVLELLCVANPAWWANAPAIMSEALSTALTNLFLAVVLWRIAGDRRASLALSAVLIGLATCVRPINVVFLPVAMLVEWMLTPSISVAAIGRLSARCLILLLGLLVGYFVTPLAQYALRGEVAAANPLARGLLQKTMFHANDSQPPGIDKPDFETIEGAVQPARTYLAKIPIRIRPPLERSFADALRFDDIIPRLARLHHTEQGWRIDRVLSSYALAQIRRSPFQYMSRVLVEDGRLLSYQDFRDRRTQSDLADYLASHPLPHYEPVPELADTAQLERRAEEELGIAPLPPSAVAQIGPAKPKPMWLIVLQRTIYTGAAVLGAFGAVLGVFGAGADLRWRPMLVALAMAGLLLHAEALLTTVSEYGLVRYMTPLWPAVCLIYASAAWIIASAWMRRRERQAETLLHSSV